MKILTEVQKAYVAGLFDGEGNISANINRGASIGSSKKRQINYVARITNTDENVIRTIHTWCGNGFVRKEFNRGYPGAKPVFRLVFSSAQADELLRQILPYLIIKRKKAELFLKLRDSRRLKYNKGQPRSGETGRFVSAGGIRYSPEEEIMLAELRR